jgi:signal transduction histidine kinase
VQVVPRIRELARENEGAFAAELWVEHLDHLLAVIKAVERRVLNRHQHMGDGAEMEGVQQVINVPLFAKGRLVGAFDLGTRHTRLVTPEEMSLLSSIGQQIAIAVENARLYDQAEQSAAIAERHRLSRELHDSVTQSLYSVTMYAEAAARLLDAGDTATAAGHLRELRETAQGALREMRLLIFELRPPALAKIGLAAALQARLDSVEMRGGIQTELHVDGIQNSQHLSRAAEEELYHIAQEALNNILKHADAQHVWVCLCFSEAETFLAIRDDGIGFIPTAAGNGGLGLASLRERAEKIEASLKIESSPGAGTEITVIVPSTQEPTLEIEEMGYRKQEIS